VSHTGLSIREVRQNVSEIKRRMHMNIDSMKCYTIDSHIYVLLFSLPFRAGNCDMSRFEATEGKNWLAPMLDGSSRCGPDGPPEGLY
jgi:hypothetical protein